MSAMLYVVRGIVLALAWFMIVNVAAGAVAAGVARRSIARDTAKSPAFWLGVRLFPAAAATLFIAAFFLPSYWMYEPREFAEGFDVTLTSLAAGALIVVAAAGARGIVAWRRAARRTEAWMRAARPVALGHRGVVAFAIDDEAPMMALVGVLRPRLLVTRGLLAALTGEELDASVAHEIGHWRAWDNLKRLGMRAAPDLLAVTSSAHAIERRWAAAAEQAADRRAAGDDNHTRCALASALVKVARLMPPPAPVNEPISTLLDGGEIASRVEHLLDDRALAPSARDHSTGRQIVLAIMTVTLVLGYTPLLQIVHSATEVLVNTLP
jgi:Zn-dependent protease with chaperone function